MSTDIDYILSEGRATFASLATDTCFITRAATPGELGYVDTSVLDAHGQYPQQGRAVVYQGPSRVVVKANINSNVVETTAGEREWTYLTAMLQVPVVTPEGAIGDVADIDVDHVCTILDAPHDPSMVGSEFNIQGRVGPKSHEVYRRYRLRLGVA